MGLRRELLHQRSDHELDRTLETEAGRESWWRALKDQADEDSMVGLMETTKNVAGDIIECGVYRGSSLFRMCRALHDTGARKNVIACDTFQGFPEETVTSRDSTLFRTASKLRSKFRVANDVPDRIARFAQVFDMPISACCGPFNETLPKLLLNEDLRFSFVHLDVDLYESYKFCLDLLYDRVSPGGLVVFDDYESRRWPGAKRAIDEFFAERVAKPERSSIRVRSAWYVQKPGLDSGEQKANASGQQSVHEAA